MTQTSQLLLEYSMSYVHVKSSHKRHHRPYSLTRHGNKNKHNQALSTDTCQVIVLQLIGLDGDPQLRQLWGEESFQIKGLLSN